MRDENQQLHFDTRAIHAGQAPEPRTGAISVPIFQTSTYVQRGPGEHTGYEYSRTQNPTREALEQCLASLEGGTHGIVYSSGMAAISTVMTLLKSGDHVICSDDVYGGTYRVFETVFRRYGLEYTYVNTSDLEEIAAAAGPATKMLWVESPTNPLLKITDLAAAAELCRSRQWVFVVDNTFASPYFQQPLALGADVALHSMTKYIGGHADAVGGCVVTANEQIAERLRFTQNAAGACLGPFDCWVFLRGLKTLGLRMRQHEANAQKVAVFLEQHPRVRRVIYPGLPSHPHHQLANRQMTGFGGIVSFYLAGDVEAARRVCQATRLFQCAESLGGVESLIEHPGIMTHASIPEIIRREKGLTDDLIRLSVGIEDAEDLIDDLDTALRSA
jgi:cystathionine gamma-lyase